MDLTKTTRYKHTTRTRTGKSAPDRRLALAMETFMDLEPLQLGLRASSGDSNPKPYKP